MSKDRSKFSSFEKEQKIFEDWRNYLHDEDLQIKLISEQKENPLNAQLAQLRKDTAGKAEDTDTIVGSMAADKPIAKAGDFVDEAQPGAAAAVGTPQPEGESLPRRTITSQEAGKPAEIAARGDALAMAAARKNIEAYKSGKISPEKFKKTKARIVADEESRAMAKDRPEFEEIGYVPPTPGKGFELDRGGEYWIQDADGMPVPLTMGGEGAHVGKYGPGPGIGVGLESEYMTGKTDLPSKKAMMEMDPPMMVAKEVPDPEGGYPKTQYVLTDFGRSYAMDQYRSRQKREAEAGTLAEQLGGVHKPQARRARRSLDAISNVSGLSMDPDDAPVRKKRTPRSLDDIGTPGASWEGGPWGAPGKPDFERFPGPVPKPETEPGPWEPAPMPQPETEPGPWQPAPMPETEPGPWEPAPMPQPKPRTPAGPWDPPSRRRAPTGVFDPGTKGPTPTMMERIIREELEAVLAEQTSLSLGGAGGPVQVNQGPIPDFSGLMNYKFPGADKMPWEMDPELMRAIYPQGAPNPFIPGAGSDDPAYAATYPEGHGRPTHPSRGFEAAERQQLDRQLGGAPSRGIMPGEHAWKDAWKDPRNLQPEVHKYEPPPQKTTDKRSWSHNPPDKNWSKQESWSTGTPQPGESEEEANWHKWALGAREDLPPPEEGDWEAPHLRVMKQAQKKGPKGRGKKMMNQQQMQDYVSNFINQHMGTKE